MAFDTKFGVTKEQKNLFGFAGIYGHNKVFTAMCYFMPSKETKAYHWEMRPSLQHLVTDKTLSFNQYIAYDQKRDIYQPLRELMENVPCLNTSRNRLKNTIC